jgi:hypothetical protein
VITDSSRQILPSQTVGESKPASEVITDSGAMIGPAGAGPTRSPTASACGPYRPIIEEAAVVDLCLDAALGVDHYAGLDRPLTA